MDFGLTQDQEIFRAACQEFAEREIAPRWKEADDQAHFPTELTAAAASAGLLGVSIPERHGGQGAGVLEEAILYEECAQANSNLAAGLMLQGSLLPGIITGSGTQDQVTRYATPTLAGEQILALAVTEPQAGSDVAAVRTTAREKDGGWVLNGEKCFITLGHQADALVTLAVVDRDRGIDGMNLFIVDVPASGVSVRKMEMLANRPIPTSQVFFDEAFVQASNRIDAGFREVMQVFDKERILVAARWIGHAQQALDWALEYSKSRQQFGKRIGDFQSIGFGLADAATALDAARLLVYRAAWSWDSAKPPKAVAFAASQAKLAATRVVRDISDLALHIGGGWALVADELPIAKIAIDSWVAPVAGGSWEIQRRIIARHLGLRTE